MKIRTVIALIGLAFPAHAQDIDTLAGKKIVFLGDSITQDGLYVSYASYYLHRLYPSDHFDIISLGLGSETLSGLSEENHAGGMFPRPCLFERLGRILDQTKPEVVIACYGINDGIYQPLEEQRFAAFRDGVMKLVAQCKEAGVRDLFLITPPIHDAPPGDTSQYDAVMAAYAKWQMSLKVSHVYGIDLHTAMRKARDARAEPFSKDRIHPGEEGHLLMARTILAGLGVNIPDESPATIGMDPLFKQIDRLRNERSKRWMNHIGYTREKTVPPQELGDTETRIASMQKEIDTLRRGRQVELNTKQAPQEAR